MCSKRSVSQPHGLLAFHTKLAALASNASEMLTSSEKAEFHFVGDRPCLDVGNDVRHGLIETTAIAVDCDAGERARAQPLPKLRVAVKTQAGGSKILGRLRDQDFPLVVPTERFCQHSRQPVPVQRQPASS